ncbi:hypothetical protein ACVWZ4_007108 [Bradyrhizobium sp. USDA 4472]
MTMLTRDPNYRCRWFSAERIVASFGCVPEFLWGIG